MRYLKLPFLLLTISFISACNCGNCTAPDRYYLKFSPVYNADDGYLYVLRHRDLEKVNHGDSKKARDKILYVFNEEQKKWLELAKFDASTVVIHEKQVAVYNDARVQAIYNLVLALDQRHVYLNSGLNHVEKLVNAEHYVEFDANKSYIRNIETNEIVKTTILPTVDEISAITGIALVDARVFYHFLKTRQLDWSEEYIAAVCERYAENDEGLSLCQNYHYFYLNEEQGGWQVESVGTLSEHKTPPRGKYANYSGASVSYRSFGGDLSLCVFMNAGLAKKYAFINAGKAKEYKTKCFLRINGQVRLQSTTLWDIYPQYFSAAYRNGNHYFHNYTFDEVGNLHAFFRKREDIDRSIEDYFYYAFYSVDNPSVPLYQQKFHWNKK